MVRSETIVNSVLVVLAGCALTITGLLVRRELSSALEIQDLKPTRIDDWQKYSDNGRRVGPANAKVVVVEFSDFQCPFCKVAAQSLARIRAQYPNDVAIIYRHFPLEAAHPHALAAALASECAGQQAHFQQFHDLLFEKQDSIGILAWEEFGRRAQVPDEVRFQKCLRDRTYLSNVERDVATARQLKATGTPLILVNNYRFAGAPADDVLKEYVERALKEA